MTARSIFYSRRLRSDFTKGSVRPNLGDAHYSYSNVSDKFVHLFEKTRIIATELTRPEIYSLPDILFEKRSIHLIFKPFDEIRYLHGGVNIAHVAWEFEKFAPREDWSSGDKRNQEPFQDYVAMMKHLDQVWVGSRFAADVVARYGIKNIKVVPAPIAMRRNNLSDLQLERKIARCFQRTHGDSISFYELSTRAFFLIASGETPPSFAASYLADANKKVFLFVGNHNDLRKNLPALLDGFAMAAASNPNVVLLIKLVMDNIVITRKHFFEKLPVLYDIAGRNWGEICLRNIYFTNEYLSLEQMTALYKMADFYVSASIAEGQNLPILEAMAEGVVPVCGRHTAMNDYISEETGIVIASSRQPAPTIFSEAYGITGLTLDTIEARDVSASVVIAANLEGSAYRALQEAAWVRVATDFSCEGVSPIVEAALAECDD